MIWDSVPWKQEIERRASSLRRRKKQKRWGAISVAKLEQDVFYAAFAVRKLIEAFRVSNEVESLLIVAEEHPPRNKVVDVMNWHRIDELFDLSSKKRRTFCPKELCHQIIHSFVFVPCLDDDTASLSGFFIASDWQKKKSLFFVNIDEIIKMLEAIANDNIESSIGRRDPESGEMKVIAKSCRSDPRYLETLAKLITSNPKM
ncbi:MAG: hypothetical protein ACC613_09205 [Synergistales bacterium]